MIGRDVSHYRIIEKIGQGGMGVVYKAEDTTLHRTVALKFLPGHLVAADAEARRFVQEARAVAALDHPNICTIYEIDTKNDPPFISMAYVAGRNLDDVLADGPLESGVAVRYATQVARGLEEAHSKGVVHRDVKSANVVISERGHAIVMDFGLAMLPGQTRLTQAGTTVGTVAYMAPEVAQGGEADSRSDLWSVGVMLYRMLAGRYPFAGAHPAAIMYSIMNEPHEPLSAACPGVSPALERIVDRALAKDPAERYQSASEMIADLKAARDGSGVAVTPPTTASPARPRASRRGWMFAVIAVVAVVLGVSLWIQMKGAPETGEAEAPEGRVSIAVLPLASMSPDDSQDYIADGMTEALIAELAQIHALRVISRTSVMRFKETTQSIPEIAKVLGVSTIIEGSVLHSGGRVRITAQLIDASTDEHMWADNYERDISDVLALQGEVARAIANAVQVELTPRENQRLASASKVDPRAYDLYLRGRHHWYRRTRPDLERAMELFGQAVDIQPDWALAYSAMAQTLSVMKGWDYISPLEANPRIREYAHKALDLDPGLGAPWATLASVEPKMRWDWDEVERYYRRAIDLEPGNADLHQWYAEFLTTRGRFDEAREEIELAQRIDPLASIIGTVKVWLHIEAGDVAAAIAEGERLLAMDPDFSGVYMPLGDAFRYDGQFERAVEAYGRFYERVSPGAGRAIKASFEAGGMDAVHRTILGGMRQARATGYVSPASMGFRFAVLGEADSAFKWLELAYDARANPIEEIAVSRYCEPIHEDPRFKDLLRRMNLDDVRASYLR